MEISRRAALSQFLKSRRARIAPSEVGLPDRERRRTPGLRREDVAALSGVSLTWYTSLEQGRNTRVSAEILERIAGTLRLSGVEREYLFELAQDRPAPLHPGEIDPVSPAMARMLKAQPGPAYIMTMRWDVVAWNAMCAELLRDFAALPEGGRNLLRILFADRSYPGDEEEYEAMAHRVVGKLRVDYSQFPGDAGLESLVTELSAAHPDFRELWNTPEISPRSEGISRVTHPGQGVLTLEHSSYVPEGAPTLRVVIFAPHDAETAAALSAIAKNL